MKKSQLKEMIKNSFLAEAENENEDLKKHYEGAIKDTEDHIADLKGNMEDFEKKLADLKKDKLSEASDDSTEFMKEEEEVDVEDNEKVDVDIEKDVEVDDESVESDIEVKGSMPGEDADEVAVQSLLMKAQEEAAKLGDEKLTDQIGNTITYFTRAHVSKVDADVSETLNEEVARFKKLAGLIK
jgi:hypothetical protein